ncbi:MAG TPA: copper resistance protein NlpE N-terminal domain-containing protein [Draconibacterium sp.]|nr:copper resistance protein NlpE N-terminal domain-containing protein [Draconibacterium sp.]
MKTQISIIIAILLFLSITSCNSQRKSTTQKQVTTSDNSMTSLDWPGTYQGILPCADCEGIKSQLILNEDLTYNLKIQYIGKLDSVFQEKGKFKWNDAGSAIILDNANNQIYQVGENILFHLDKNGNRITGELADKYTLKKDKIELTGKYWKLNRLNGQPVKSSNREPFIRLNTDNSVNGNSSCNSFNGNYKLTDGNGISFSPFAMTKMACIDNNIEAEFMQVLEKTTSYSLSSNELIFQDEFETSLAIFEADFFK